MQNKPINMNTEDITSRIGKGSYAPHQIKEIAHQKLYSLLKLWSMLLFTKMQPSNVTMV
jgi:hypothetical protein